MYKIFMARGMHHYSQNEKVTASCASMIIVATARGDVLVLGVLKSRREQGTNN